MKNLFTILGLAAVVLFSTISCTEEDNVVDDVLTGVTSGAVLRTISIIANEIPIGDDTALFSIEVEEQDNQDGALLESVDVYTTFADGSPDDGDSSAATTSEVFLFNIPASSFTAGPFGLPRATITIPATDLIAAVNLTNDALFGGDAFTTRLALNLTDGRTFSVDNAGGIITGGFFNSPFQYTTPIVCPVDETEFIGDYVLSNVIPSDFGDIYKEGSVVTLEAGTTSVERMFTAVVLEDLGVGQPATPLVFQMVCNQVVVSPDQGTSLQCGGALLLGPPIDAAPGTYVTGDDSTFNIVIGYNETAAATCAVPLDVEISLTRQ